MVGGKLRVGVFKRTYGVIFRRTRGALPTGKHSKQEHAHSPNPVREPIFTNPGMVAHAYASLANVR